MFSSPLARDAPLVGFSDWWLGTAIAVDQMLTLTRQQIVASWANKFGGAHVDPGEPEANWSIAGGLGLHVWVSPHPPRPGVVRTFSTAAAVERPGPQWMRLKEDSAAWSMSAAVLERIATELLSGLEAVDIDRVLTQS